MNGAGGVFIATQQGSEILAIFDDLNSNGVTIVMVTHDPSVAAHAKRFVFLRDGCVQSDRADGRQRLESFSETTS